MFDIEALREKAKQAKKALIDVGPDRPFFIEFSGSPKSGKSTCIDIVAHFFRRLNFRIMAPTEGASKRTPYYLKDDITAFNTWSACYALTHVLEGLYHSDRHDIAILDRGLFDALAWFELLATMGEIQPDERDKIHEFLLLPKWQGVIDYVFLFKANPETSMGREGENHLIQDHGRAMNPEFLGMLDKAYDRTLSKFADYFQNLKVVDTSKEQKSSPKSTANEVVSDIVEVIIGRYP
ncbi:MAG: hypothetical protein IH975_03615 [Nitrospinae bacterium]|nr:hypothetical protein [Nitrospinota bacterium]